MRLAHQCNRDDTPTHPETHRNRPQSSDRSTHTARKTSIHHLPFLSSNASSSSRALSTTSPSLTNMRGSTPYATAPSTTKTVAAMGTTEAGSTPSTRGSRSTTSGTVPSPLSSPLSSPCWAPSPAWLGARMPCCVRRIRARCMRAVRAEGPGGSAGLYRLTATCAGCFFFFFLLNRVSASSQSIGWVCVGVHVYCTCVLGSQDSMTHGCRPGYPQRKLVVRSPPHITVLVPIEVQREPELVWTGPALEWMYILVVTAERVAGVSQ
ncbi:hypothetical protein F5148DRAFT_506502 [Russula earlei]|uniref:Uncharacterized protein n=1 Tax=Russula earlei TaxID=71964 RepID=A0ACC0UG90_9AGAM|nr:hypothetical protein F5148DRAFT_506502 [Russula earlei]